MTDIPYRLRIQMNLTAALEEIARTDGYTYDLAGAVFRGRNLFGDDDPETMVSILEPHVPPDQIDVPDDSQYEAGDYALLVQGFAPDDPANPTDPAHFLMADVKRRLVKLRNPAPGTHTPDILGMGNTITKLRIGGGTVRPPDGEVSSKAYFWLHVVLRITEDLENPFA